MIDYIKDFHSDVLLAQGKDTNFLMLRKAKYKIRRFDGKYGIYVLEYRWLSCECENEKDESYVCVKGSETQIYTQKELEKLGVLKNRKVQDINLFDVFALF